MRSYDFIMYGDSITAHMGENWKGVWDDFFGGLKSAPLGILGNNVEEFAWRVMVRGVICVPCVCVLCGGVAVVRSSGGGLHGAAGVACGRRRLHPAPASRPHVSAGGRGEV